jgi:hypothetical protein
MPKMVCTWWLALPAIATIVSAITFFFAWTTKQGSCAIEAGVDENLRATIETLNSVIELGLTLSTGLVGLGAALLIGIQGNLTITRSVITITFLSMMALAQSILYGVWWKIGIANLWFDGCLADVASPALQTRYLAHFYFMLAGMAFLGLLVMWASIQRLAQEGRGG